MDISVAETASRLSEHGVALELTDAARDWLAQEGYDRVFGARPLRRAVQLFIENPLSRKIVAREFSEGDRITAHAADDGDPTSNSPSPSQGNPLSLLYRRKYRS